MFPEIYSMKQGFLGSRGWGWGLGFGVIFCYICQFEKSESLFACICNCQICSYLLCHMDGLVQDCGISGAFVLEIPQSCTKPLIYFGVNCVTPGWGVGGYKLVFSKHYFENIVSLLTHWGWVTHICVGKLAIIGSDNGLSPGRRQAVIWNSAGILLTGTLGTNFSDILIGIQVLSFKEIHLKMSSAKRCPFCLSLNVVAFLVLRLEHSRWTRSILWLLMP